MFSIDTINQTIQEYYASRTNERMGQWLCNKLNVTEESVFYEKDRKKAIEIFIDKYAEKT